MRLSEENMRECRKAMIQNAFQLFCEKGIESVKLIDIAKTSHVSEATIYRYFGNKEKLVMEAFMKLWDEIMTNVYRDVEAVADYQYLTGYEQIQIWIEGFGHLYEDYGDFIIFSYEAKLYLLRHGMKLDQFHQYALMHAFRTPCLAALVKGKKDGTIPASKSSEDLFYAIWGTVCGYVVKIVICNKLYVEGSPWESRYQIMKEGLLSALSSGWNPPKPKI